MLLLLSVCLQYVVHTLWLQFTQPEMLTLPYKLYKKASTLPLFVEYFTTVGKLLGGGNETAIVAEEVFRFESSLAQVIYIYIYMYIKKPLWLYWLIMYMEDECWTVRSVPNHILPQNSKQSIMSQYVEFIHDAVVTFQFDCLTSYFT